MKFLSAVNLLLTTLFAVNSVFGQPPVNDACSNPMPLCPNVPVTASNQQATATVCPNCEDNFNFCFSGTNSVWFSFTTNTVGGDVSINFSALNFNPQANRGTQLQAAIIQAVVPCNASTFTQIGNCEAGSAGNFSLTALALPPNTDYYVVVNGGMNGGATLPAEAGFTVAATGTGINRLPAGSSIGGPPAPFCPKQTILFSAYLANCVDTSAVTWKVNGVIEAVTTGTYWQTSGIENGDVITMECSCFTDCPQNLTAQFGPVVVENLVVNAGADQTIANGASVILSGTTNGTSYNWTPTPTIATPTALQTIALPQSTTTYSLTAHSANCSLSDEVVITVGGEFVIPGSFSPNGDGANDTWIIKGIDNYPDAQIRIFTRWGQEILNIAGYSSQKNWDGTNNGKDVTDGTYFYVIDLHDGKDKDPIKGFVMVVR